MGLPISTLRSTTLIDPGTELSDRGAQRDPEITGPDIVVQRRKGWISARSLGNAVLGASTAALAITTGVYVHRTHVLTQENNALRDLVRAGGLAQQRAGQSPAPAPVPALSPSLAAQLEEAGGLSDDDLADASYGYVARPEDVNAVNRRLGIDPPLEDPAHPFNTSLDASEQGWYAGSTLAYGPFDAPMFRSPGVPTPGDLLADLGNTASILAEGGDTTQTLFSTALGALAEWNPTFIQDTFADFNLTGTLGAFFKTESLPLALGRTDVAIKSTVLTTFDPEDGTSVVGVPRGGPLWGAYGRKFLTQLAQAELPVYDVPSAMQALTGNEAYRVDMTALSDYSAAALPPHALTLRATPSQNWDAQLASVIRSNGQKAATLEVHSAHALQFMPGARNGTVYVGNATIKPVLGDQALWVHIPQPSFDEVFFVGRDYILGAPPTLGEVEPEPLPAIPVAPGAQSTVEFIDPTGNTLDLTATRLQIEAGDSPTPNPFDNAPFVSSGIPLEDLEALAALPTKHARIQVPIQVARALVRAMNVGEF